jgi:hypothetical protein
VESKRGGIEPMTMKKKKKGYGLEIKISEAVTVHPISYFGQERVHSMCL